MALMEETLNAHTKGTKNDWNVHFRGSLPPQKNTLKLLSIVRNDRTDFHLPCSFYNQWFCKAWKGSEVFSTVNDNTRGWKWHLEQEQRSSALDVHFCLKRQHSWHRHSWDDGNVQTTIKNQSQGTAKLKLVPQTQRGILIYTKNTSMQCN